VTTEMQMKLDWLIQSYRLKLELKNILKLKLK